MDKIINRIDTHWLEKIITKFFNMSRENYVSSSTFQTNGQADGRTGFATNKKNSKLYKVVVWTTFNMVCKFNTQMIISKVITNLIDSQLQIS